MNTKMRILLFILCLLTASLCFSQGTYRKQTEDTLIRITPTELKQINLIFNEHDKLIKTDSLLKAQLKDYKIMLSYSDSISTIREKQLEDCVEFNNATIEQLNNKVNSIKKWSTFKNWAIGVLGVTAILLGILR